MRRPAGSVAASGTHTPAGRAGLAAKLKKFAGSAALLGVRNGWHRPAAAAGGSGLLFRRLTEKVGLTKK